MAAVNAIIRVDIDASAANAGLASMAGQMQKFNKGMIAGSAAMNAAQIAAANRAQGALNRTGQWIASTGSMMTAAGRMHKQFDKGTMASWQQWRDTSAKTTRAMGQQAVMTQMAAGRVRALQTQYTALGREVEGTQKYMKAQPTGMLKQWGADAMFAQQKAVLFNRRMQMGANSMINWGKNTQWAGRQMMVGMGIPLGIAAVGAVRSFKDIEQASISFKRVYGDATTSAGEKAKMLGTIQEGVAQDMTKYGIAVSDTLSVAAKAAATGQKGDDLVTATRETMRLATLGQIDYDQALESTIATQTAFGVSSKGMVRVTDFLNAAENQTILSMDDMTKAIPRVAPVIRGLGGDIEDLGVLMTALRAGGVTAEQGANALKSGLGSLINPTSGATAAMEKFGIPLDKIVNANKGDLIGTVQDFGKALNELPKFDQQQALEALFGKYQYARMGALFKNINSKQAKETARLSEESSANLAKMSDNELSQISDSALNKFQGAVERLKAAAAPLGEAILNILAPIVDFGANLLGFFNDNSAAAWGAGIALAFAGVAGVVTMLTGVFANFAGTMAKGALAMRSMGRWAMGKPSLRYNSIDDLEAAAAQRQLSAAADGATASLYGEKGAVNQLTAALNAMNAELRENVGLQAAAAGGAPIAGGGRTRGAVATTTAAAAADRQTMSQFRSSIAAGADRAHISRPISLLAPENAAALKKIQAAYGPESSVGKAIAAAQASGATIAGKNGRFLAMDTILNNEMDRVGSPGVKGIELANDATTKGGDVYKPFLRQLAYGAGVSASDMVRDPAVQRAVEGFHREYVSSFAGMGENYIKGEGFQSVVEPMMRKHFGSLPGWDATGLVHQISGEGFGKLEVPNSDSAITGWKSESLKKVSESIDMSGYKLSQATDGQIDAVTRSATETEKQATQTSKDALSQKQAQRHLVSQTNAVAKERATVAKHEKTIATGMLNDKKLSDAQVERYKKEYLPNAQKRLAAAEAALGRPTGIGAVPTSQSAASLAAHKRLTAPATGLTPYELRQMNNAGLAARGGRTGYEGLTGRGSFANIMGSRRGMAAGVIGSAWGGTKSFFGSMSKGGVFDRSPEKMDRMMGGVSGKLMGMGMAAEMVTMGLMMSGKEIPIWGHMLGTGMMTLGMMPGLLTPVLALLSNPVTAALAAVAAVAGAGVVAWRYFNNKAAEAGEAAGEFAVAGKATMEGLAKEYGSQPLSVEVAQRKQAKAQNATVEEVQQADQVSQSEIGKKIAEGYTQALTSGGQDFAQSSMVNTLATAVLQKVLSPGEAKALSTSLIGDVPGAQVSSQLDALIGKNGQLINQDPTGFAMTSMSRSAELARQASLDPSIMGKGFMDRLMEKSAELPMGLGGLQPFNFGEAFDSNAGDSWFEWGRVGDFMGGLGNLALGGLPTGLIDLGQEQLQQTQSAAYANTLWTNTLSQGYDNRVAAEERLRLVQLARSKAQEQMQAIEKQDPSGYKQSKDWKAAANDVERYSGMLKKGNDGLVQFDQNYQEMARKGQEAFAALSVDGDLTAQNQALETQRTALAARYSDDANAMESYALESAMAQQAALQIQANGGRSANETMNAYQMALLTGLGPGAMGALEDFTGTNPFEAISGLMDKTSGGNISDILVAAQSLKGSQNIIGEALLNAETANELSNLPEKITEFADLSKIAQNKLGGLFGESSAEDIKTWGRLLSNNKLTIQDIIDAAGDVDKTTGKKTPDKTPTPRTEPEPPPEPKATPKTTPKVPARTPGEPGASTNLDRGTPPGYTGTKGLFGTPLAPGKKPPFVNPLLGFGTPQSQKKPPTAPAPQSGSGKPVNVKGRVTDLQVATNVKPIRVEAKATKVSMTGQAKPIRVEAKATKVQMTGNAKPIRVEARATKVKVTGKADPVRVEAKATKVSVTGKADPVKVEAKVENIEMPDEAPQVDIDTSSMSEAISMLEQVSQSAQQVDAISPTVDTSAPGAAAAVGELTSVAIAALSIPRTVSISVSVSAGNAFGTIAALQKAAGSAYGGYVGGYADGGALVQYNDFKRRSAKISGRGGPKADEIPTMLSNGEFVIRASSVRKYGTGFLNKVNRGHIDSSVVPHLNTGSEGAEDSKKKKSKEDSEEKKDKDKGWKDLNKSIKDLAKVWEVTTKRLKGTVLPELGKTKKGKRATIASPEMMSALLGTDSPNAVKNFFSKGKKAKALQQKLQKQITFENTKAFYDQYAADSKLIKANKVRLAMIKKNKGLATELNLASDEEVMAYKKLGMSEKKGRKSRKAWMKTKQKVAAVEFNAWQREQKTAQTYNDMREKAAKRNPAAGADAYQMTDEEARRYAGLKNNKKRDKFFKNQVQKRIAQEKKLEQRSTYFGRVDQLANDRLYANRAGAAFSGGRTLASLGLNETDISTLSQEDFNTMLSLSGKELEDFAKAVKYAGIEAENAALSQSEKTTKLSDLMSQYAQTFVDQQAALAGLEIIKESGGWTQQQLEAYNQQDTVEAARLGQDQTLLQREIDDVNKAYDAQVKILDKVVAAQTALANLERARLGVASALSQGDIAGAAAAAQEARAQQAQFAQEQMRQGLEDEREAKVKQRQDEIDRLQDRIDTLNDQIFERQQIIDRVFAEAGVNSANMASGLEKQRLALIANEGYWKTMRQNIVDSAAGLKSAYDLMLLFAGLPPINPLGDTTSGGDTGNTGGGAGNTGNNKATKRAERAAKKQGRINNRAGNATDRTDDIRAKAKEAVNSTKKKGDNKALKKFDDNFKRIKKKEDRVQSATENGNWNIAKTRLENIDKSNDKLKAKLDKAGLLTKKKPKKKKANAHSSGGWVPGTGSGDTVPSFLTPGEYVLSKDNIKRGAKFLETMKNPSYSISSQPGMLNAAVQGGGMEYTGDSNTFNVTVNVSGGNMDANAVADIAVRKMKDLSRSDVRRRRV